MQSRSNGSPMVARRFLPILCSLFVLLAGWLVVGNRLGMTSTSDSPNVVSTSRVLPVSLRPQEEKDSLQARLERLEAMPTDQLRSEFDDQMKSWRHNFALLAQAHIAFHNVREEDSGPWASQFRKAKREGEAARSQAALVSILLAERLEAPLDPDVVAMVFHSMEESLIFERYQLGYRAGKALLDSGIREPVLLGMQGFAAWSNNQFTEARELFAEALVAGHEMPLQYRQVNQLLDSAMKDAEEEAQLAQKDQNLPRARIVTTKGTLEVELFEDQAPNTVANFIKLAEKGFYDGQEFFATDKSYLTTGSPTNDASGNAGYEIKAEFEQEERRHHFRGTLTLMVVEETGNGSSQFSILTQPMPTLDETKNTVFGRVINGEIVLDDIARNGEDWKELAKTSNFKLEDPDRILSIEITHKRDHEYEPDVKQLLF